MKVRCYPEGRISEVRSYTLDVPADATGRALRELQRTAQTFAEDYSAEETEDYSRPLNVVLEPDDDDARVLPGWHPAEAPDDRPFRLFVARPHVEVTWTTEEVITFNPRARLP